MRWPRWGDDNVAWVGLLLVAALVVLLLVVNANAHDHLRAELDDWFKGLKSADGNLCCSGNEAKIADDWETKDGHYRVSYGGKWYDVPDGAVIKGPNRAGKTMVWLMYVWYGPSTTTGYNTVRCFMPGTMT
jgi:hypothetical protein